MWIATNNWHKSHTDLSKYFIERIRQRVDTEEIISNRHRTCNGYTMIEEVCEVASMTLKRIKSIRRLHSALEESRDKKILSNIINDYILKKYHSDIVEYYKKLDVAKLNAANKYFSDFLIKSQIHAKRLEQQYLLNIISELKQIDFDSDQFERNARLIDKLIDCLIPYIIFKGYSNTSISDIAFRAIGKSANNCAIDVVNRFNGSKEKYIFLLKTNKDCFEVKTITDYLKNKNASYSIVSYEEVKEYFAVDLEYNEETVFLKIDRSTKDPHNYLRNLYEICLKKYVTSKDRLDLSPLNDFFERVYWKFDNKKFKYQKSNFNIDPLNVAKRKSTLRDTLQIMTKSDAVKFTEQSEIPYIDTISESIFYYNLALGSKSIENSLSLLWTTLETLIPYRIYDNDISNVQYFVSKILSAGAIGREVTGFAIRFNTCNNINNKPFDEFGFYTNYLDLKPDKIKYYLNWLCNVFPSDNDPFDKLKEHSILLSSEFCRLNDNYTGTKSYTVKNWIDKINYSKDSIHYQLDRIYLHRNQIVHSGKFINEYSNLWSHLEWYVGKLLSICVLKYLENGTLDKEQLFYELEGYCDNLTHQLTLNSSKKICEIKDFHQEVLKHSWQFF